MDITLRFFASVREALGTAQENLTLPPGVTTVGAVREHLVARGGVWQEALDDRRPLRMAFNHVMCDGQTALKEGGEVAFFPPVTGG
ncbi:MAG TPA: molybdopterin converting factor subunit 1 [Telluria sp.]|nr:molybdopterin converting factor subunit 1 [Telluria sp.]